MPNRNEGAVDRVVRVALGAVLVVLGFGIVEGGWGTFLGILGLVPLLTGLVGWCPLYALVGFSTAGSRSGDPART